MRRYSQINTWSTSDGQRLTRDKIERNIRKAKELKLKLHWEEHGYHFCTRCERNDCKPIDVSHNISVDECLNSGRAELSWDINNMEVIGRACHKIKDKVYL